MIIEMKELQFYTPETIVVEILKKVSAQYQLMLNTPPIPSLRSQWKKLWASEALQALSQKSENNVDILRS